MREFFKQELERLHLTTGLQQYSKLTDSEYTDLLDILVGECAKFPLIPDKDKQEYIQEFMISDPEFIGFNKRIIWKWMNMVNKNYIVTQAQYEEPKHPPAPPEIAQKYIDEWITELGKIGNSASLDEQVKENRRKHVEEMKARFGVPADKRAEIEAARVKPVCAHSQLVQVDSADNFKWCLDCGAKFPLEEPGSVTEPLEAKSRRV